MPDAKNNTLRIDSRVTLADGNSMPLLGLGTWAAKGGGETRDAVANALEAGYRHIDTAKMYDNERDVGEAVRESTVPRAEIFVTTKLWDNDQGYDAALKAFDRSLEELGQPRLKNSPAVPHDTRKGCPYLSNNGGLGRVIELLDAHGDVASLDPFHVWAGCSGGCFPDGLRQRPLFWELCRHGLVVPVAEGGPSFFRR